MKTSNGCTPETCPQEIDRNAKSLSGFGRKICCTPGAGVDLSVIGPLARTASDLDLALSIIAGPDGGAAKAYRTELPAPRATKVSDFRVLILRDHPMAEADDEITGVLEDLAERLQKEIKAVKPYLFDTDKDPPMLAAQQQMQKLTALNAELMQEAARFVLAHAFFDRDQAILGHQLRHFLVWICGKPHIAIGENANELTRLVTCAAFNNRHARNAIALHQIQRVRQRLVRIDCERIDHHAAFEFLHGAHFIGLFFRCHIAMKNANPTCLRHGNRKSVLGHRIHRRREDWQTQTHGLCEAGRDIHLARHDERMARLQQHVIEGKSVSNCRYTGHGQLLARNGPSMRVETGSFEAVAASKNWHRVVSCDGAKRKR
jgi:hypothetical protein